MIARLILFIMSYHVLSSVLTLPTFEMNVPFFNTNSANAQSLFPQYQQSQIHLQWQLSLPNIYFQQNIISVMQNSQNMLSSKQYQVYSQQFTNTQKMSI